MVWYSSSSALSRRISPSSTWQVNLKMRSLGLYAEIPVSSR